MSMWTSIQPRIEHQERDTYTGAVQPWFDADHQRAVFIDVATALEHNTLIRLLQVDAFNPTRESWAYLTCAQAVELMHRLQEAIDSIPDEVPE